MNREKITEGKTKIIWAAGDPGLVFVESKDVISAGDGKRRHIIEGKGALSNETTANCFKLLIQEGIPNHFVAPITENMFLARKLQMIPLESVARRVATGSYLQRYPKVKEGTVFRNLRQELFYKNDEHGDPLVEYDVQKGAWKMYDAHLPKNAGSLRGTMDAFWLDKVLFKIYHMSFYTKQVFGVLEKAFGKQGIQLKDLKIEFGLDYEGKLMVGDVIDADSWRTDPPLDKQKYRDLKDPTSEDLENIKADYQKAAILSRNFVK